MFRTRAYSSFAATLAILALGALTVLPGGRALKEAGPCGRALCECAPEPVSAAQQTASCCHQSAPAALRVNDEAVFAASPHAPWVFQPVFSGMLAPLSLPAPNDEATRRVLPQPAPFFLTHVALEIHTPPPRA